MSEDEDEIIRVASIGTTKEEALTTEGASEVASLEESLNAKAVFDEVREAEYKGHSIELRAYISPTGEEFVLWKFDTQAGCDGYIDVSNSKLHLTPGRVIRINGVETTKIDIPLYLTDAIVDDFIELHSKN